MPHRLLRSSSDSFTLSCRALLDHRRNPMMRERLEERLEERQWPLRRHHASCPGSKIQDFPSSRTRWRPSRIASLFMGTPAHASINLGEQYRKCRGKRKHSELRYKAPTTLRLKICTNWPCDLGILRQTYTRDVYVRPQARNQASCKAPRTHDTGHEHT